MAHFADKESNLFRGMAVEKIQQLQQPPCMPIMISVNFSDKFIKYSQAGVYHSASYLNKRGVMATYTQNETTNDIQFLTSLGQGLLLQNKVDCYKPLNESARVWFKEYDFIMIWSCSEMQEDKQTFHDAALIYGVHISQNPTNTSMYMDIVRSFQSRAITYFNDTLEDLVKWPKEWPQHKRQKCPKMDLFECPTNIKEEESLRQLIEIVILLVFIIIIVGVLLNCMIRKYCRSNQTHPL